MAPFIGQLFQKLLPGGAAACFVERSEEAPESINTDPVNDPRANPKPLKKQLPHGHPHKQYNFTKLGDASSVDTRAVVLRRGPYAITFLAQAMMDYRFSLAQGSIFRVILMIMTRLLFFLFKLIIS